MWEEAEEVDLRQAWGSFTIAHKLHFGCDARRASWEVYNPHFQARQLGYLQGCLVSLVTSRSLLSRERLSGSSEKECEEAKQEFQERCIKFHLWLNTPKTHCTNTFVDWWDAYIKDFFDASVEEISNKLFDKPPKKTIAPKSKEVAQGIDLLFLYSPIQTSFI